MGRRLTTKEFIIRAVRIHEGKYDYSKVVYVNNHTKICIICPDHGEYYQIPNSHLNGRGCSICWEARRKYAKRASQETVIIKFKEKHGDTYDYSLVEYVNDKTKVLIICDKHGVFAQTPKNHKLGQGCPACGLLNRKSNKLSEDDVIIEFNKIHKGFYTYDKVIYKGSKIPVTIVCPVHGEFEQIPENHFIGCGCNECGREKTRKGLANTQEEAIERFKETHGGLYDYSKVLYTTSKKKICIICPTHGEFYQEPQSHANGSGCPSCSHKLSQRESDINDFLSEFFITDQRNRSLLGRRELDIYIPNKKFAVEYNGSYWHSERHHKDPKWHMRQKQLDCEKQGIQLIHANDYEDQTIIKKTLSHILGIDTETYYARKCSVAVEANTVEVKEFFNNNHLQGFTQGCKVLTLRINGQLVAVMLFSRASSERGSTDKTRYELRRFASCCRVVGGASRLLKAFIRDTAECKSIISYSDNRWFTGNMYKQLGFEFIHEVPPDYKYVKGEKVQHKGRFRRARLAKREDIDFRPEETEVQNANRNGWYRIWDCGKKKWELTL